MPVVCWRSLPDVELDVVGPDQVLQSNEAELVLVQDGSFRPV